MKARLDGNVIVIDSERARKSLKLLGARWVAARSAWVLPRAYKNLVALKLEYPDVEFSQDLEAIYGMENGFGVPDPWVSGLATRIPTNISKVLKSYQLDAVKFLVSSPHKASLLTLSPGLGKTLTSITACKAVGAKRILVVAPLILLPTWQEEIKKWTGAGSTIRHQKAPLSNNWTITNYETLVKFQEEYTQKWDVLIVDESLYLLNKSSLRTKAIKAVSKKAGYTWLLSGSPVSKNSADLYGQMSILAPKAFKSYWRFARTYCHVEDDQWGSHVRTDKESRSAQSDLRDFMFVRHQRNVEKLPDFLYQTYTTSLHPEQAKIYEGFRKDFVARLDSGVEMTVPSRLSQLVRLQQCTSNPRNLGPEWPDLSGKNDLLLGLLNLEKVPLPAIIWTHWVENAKIIRSRILAETSYSCRLIQGGTRNRQEVLQDYKDGKIDVLVLSLSVGKHGLTLTNTKTMIYFEKTWDADAYIQSPARVQRLGLEHRPLMITLKAEKSTDVLIEKNLAEKAFNISKISNADLIALLRGLE